MMMMMEKGDLESDSAHHVTPEYYLMMEYDTERAWSDDKSLHLRQIEEWVTVKDISVS